MGLDLPLSLYLGCTKARWSWVYVLPITLKAVKVNFCVVPNMYHTTTALCVKTRVRRRNIGRWRETAGSVLRSSPVFLTQWIKLSVVLSHNSRLMSTTKCGFPHLRNLQPQSTPEDGRLFAFSHCRQRLHMVSSRKTNV